MAKYELHIDRDVLTRLKAGDQQAFAAIYDCYRSSIYTYVYQMLYDKTFAEDIVQSVFVALWEHRHDIDADRGVGGLLYVMARNHVYRQTERLMLRLGHEEYVRRNRPDAAEDFLNIDRSLIAKALTQLIEQLPPARREIFVMSRRGHLSNREIAHRLSISEKTVETQIRRSLIFLREKMKRYL